MAEHPSNHAYDLEELVHRYFAHPREDLKDLIMVQYAGLVERVARRFSGVEAFEDLVQVGFIGLLNALSKYDVTAGVRFNTYATYLVTGEIKHYLRDRSQTIRHPAWLQELRHKVNRATGLLQLNLGRPPTAREIGEALGVSEASIQEVLQTQEMLRVASLDQPLNSDDDGATEVDNLDAGAFCVEQLGVEDRVLLDSALSQLRDLEKEVLMLFHFEMMNQTEIASKLNISCNYVSHILRQSLNKLRKILTAEEERDALLRRQIAEIDYEVIDSQTGAYTEAYFHSRLKEEVHRAVSSERPMAVVVATFEGLNGLAKFYGEQSVLDFMSDATEFFKANLRRLDVVALLGEHGFGMILPSGANVEIVKERLLQRSSQWVAGRAPGSRITMSIGHASCPGHFHSATGLLQAAQSDADLHRKNAA